MAVVRVAAANGASATSSLTVNYPAATTAGNLLVAIVFSNVTAGNTAISGWQITEKQINAAGTTHVFYKLSTGDSSVSATSTGATLMQMHIYEYSGFPQGFVVDASATKADTTNTTATSAPITSTVAADLFIFALTVASGSITGAIWATATTVQGSSQNRIIAGQYIPGTIQTALTATASWTTTRVSASVVVAFTPRSSGDFFPFFS